VNLRMFRRVPARKRGLIAVLAAAVAASTSLAIAAGTGTAASAAPAAPARAAQAPAEATGLGQLSGLLPRSNLTLESAIEINLSQEYARLPLYPGIAYAGTLGPVSENAVQNNTAFINAMRYGGDILNVFGDFPTLTDPRHADAYSPLWDAQLGMWTPKAVSEGLNKRQIDEVQVFNLAYSRPDLLTGVNPATGQPQLYGSVGVDINCAVLGFTAKAPTANLAQPAPDSQFPPR